MSKVMLNLQLACNKKYILPTKSDFLYWLDGVLPLFCERAEITIRIVDKIESHKLNMIYRGKDWPTNILSFPFEAPPKLNLPLIGDLVICPDIVESEAYQYNMTLEVHWAHMIIHGALHLLGYNHILDKEIRKMEGLEIKIMKKLGYPNPYIIENDNTKYIPI